MFVCLFIYVFGEVGEKGAGAGAGGVLLGRGRARVCGGGDGCCFMGVCSAAAAPQIDDYAIVLPFYL